MNTKIMIVEAEPAFAAALALRLTEMGHEVVGTASSADDAVQLAVDVRPEVILLSLGATNGDDCIELAKRIQARSDTSMICLSSQQQNVSSELRAAIEIGRFQHQRRQSLLKMAETVMEALNYVDDPIFRADGDGNITFVNGPARKVLSRNGHRSGAPSLSTLFEGRAPAGLPPPQGLDSLSPREKEILGWFLRGYGTASISGRLGVSAQTVRNHLKNVCRKLAVRTQVELRELFAETTPAARRQPLSERVDLSPA